MKWTRDLTWVNCQISDVSEFVRCVSKGPMLPNGRMNDRSQVS